MNRRAQPTTSTSTTSTSAASRRTAAPCRSVLCTSATASVRCSSCRAASAEAPATLTRAVAHVGGGGANALERAFHLDLHAAHVDAEEGGLAVDVVAVTRGEGEQEQLAAVGAGAVAARPRRDRERVLGAVGAQGHAVVPSFVADLRPDVHGHSDRRCKKAVYAPHGGHEGRRARFFNATRATSLSPQASPRRSVGSRLAGCMARGRRPGRAGGEEARRAALTKGVRQKRSEPATNESA